MTHRIWIIVLALAALAGACRSQDGPEGGGDSDSDGDTDTDADTDTDIDTDTMVGAYDGVDLLLMVDDSISMAQEQAILATSIFPLVNAFTNPIQTDFEETDWPFPAVDELRLAVVTSNMGFSSNGVDNDDAWPGDIPGSCQGFGDDGAFQTATPASVTIGDDVIPCDETAAQCPADWTCDGIGADTGVGACHTGGSTAVACPALGADWASTTSAAPDPEFPIRAACLAQQGTGGCGFEQQLASAATALARPDQAEFLVGSHVLLVIVVSDEEDCSMEDGAGLFAEEEVANQALMKVNIACGEHPEHLFSPDHYYDAFVAAKGDAAVVFAAIVGVPNEGAAADACQGRGDQIGDCLEQGSMQLVAEMVDTTWYFHPACTRSVDSTQVTKAYPGRRYVALANESFGQLSYVTSICNADWTPAFLEIGAVVAPLLGE